MRVGGWALFCFVLMGDCRGGGERARASCVCALFSSASPRATGRGGMVRVARVCLCKSASARVLAPYHLTGEKKGEGRRLRRWRDGRARSHFLLPRRRAPCSSRAPRARGRPAPPPADCTHTHTHTHRRSHGSQGRLHDGQGGAWRVWGGEEKRAGRPNAARSTCPRLSPAPHSLYPLLASTHPPDRHPPEGQGPPKAALLLPGAWDVCEGGVERERERE